MVALGSTSARSVCAFEMCDCLVGPGSQLETLPGHPQPVHRCIPSCMPRLLRTRGEDSVSVSACQQSVLSVSLLALKLLPRRRHSSKGKVGNPGFLVG